MGVDMMKMYVAALLFLLVILSVQAAWSADNPSPHQPVRLPPASKSPEHLDRYTAEGVINDKVTISDGYTGKIRFVRDRSFLENGCLVAYPIIVCGKADGKMGKILEETPESGGTPGEPPPPAEDRLALQQDLSDIMHYLEEHKFGKLFIVPTFGSFYALKTGLNVFVFLTPEQKTKADAYFNTAIKRTYEDGTLLVYVLDSGQVSISYDLPTGAGGEQ